jgi:predicted RNA methylase
MSERHFGKAYGGNPPANYERFFVPAIGAPLATDLMRLAALRRGERVLDAACGTGVVARLAGSPSSPSCHCRKLIQSLACSLVSRNARKAGDGVDDGKQPQRSEGEPAPSCW